MNDEDDCINYYTRIYNDSNNDEKNVYCFMNIPLCFFLSFYKSELAVHRLYVVYASET
jgi:hypothetical protein